MRGRSLERALACGMAFFAAALLLSGAAHSSGLVTVRINPNIGLPGTKIDITADGFNDQNITTSTPPSYWAEIGIDSATIMTNVPVDAAMTWDMKVAASGVAVNAAPGDHTIWVAVHARDAKGTRYIDDGGMNFRVLDPGPAHPLTVTMHVTAPSHALVDTDIVANVTLQSGPGDRTKVGLEAIVLDQAGKLVQSLNFPPAPGQTDGIGTDRIEMMDPNRTEQFSSVPFRLRPGTWHLHFHLIVNNTSSSGQDRTVTVAKPPPAPMPHKLPPTLVPGMRQ